MGTYANAEDSLPCDGNGVHRGNVLTVTKPNASGGEITLAGNGGIAGIILWECANAAILLGVVVVMPQIHMLGPSAPTPDGSACRHSRMSIYDGTAMPAVVR